MVHVSSKLVHNPQMSKAVGNLFFSLGVLKNGKVGEDIVVVSINTASAS